MSIPSNAEPSQAPIATAAPSAAPAADDPIIAAALADESFMNDVLGKPSTAAPVTGAEPKAPVAAPDEATKRYEYWQGQADQFRTELEKVRPLADEYNRFAPVVEYLKQNPEAFEKVAAMKESPKPSQTLQEPVPPVKPANFDPYNMDPQSESFRYKVAREEYLQQLTEITYAKQKLSEQETLAQRQREQQAQAQGVKMKELTQTLQTQYGFAPEQTQDFIQTMNDASSMNMDNLVNLYKVIKHRAKTAGMARNAALPSNLPPPPPVGGSGAANAAQPTEEEAFWGGIGAFGKRTL